MAHIMKIDEFFNFGHSFDIDGIKDEISSIINSEGREIVEWKYNDNYVVFYDDINQRGMVFKTERDAKKSLYKTDEMWEEIEALKQTLTNVDILVENGMGRNEAERLVRNGNLEKTYKRLVDIAGAEISYGDSYELRNGYVMYYPNLRS